MFYVPDLSKLEKEGFTRTHENIWEFKLFEENGVNVYFLVNSYERCFVGGETRYFVTDSNELKLYVDVENLSNTVDNTISLDKLLDLLNKGIVVKGD